MRSLMRKLPLYIKGIAQAVLTSKPRDALKMASNSPYVIECLKEHGFSIILSVRDPAVSRPILCIGQYEKNVTDVLISHLKDDTHFLDIGACIGYFSLLVAVRCPHGRVFSFEPDPNNFRLFKASIAINGLESRITLYQKAVSDSDRPIFFSDLGYADNLGARFTAKGEDILKKHSVKGATQPREVQAVCLDSLLANERIDLVKVDIEGYEPNAFRGMEALLRKNRPVIITEFAPGTIQHISETDPQSLLRFFTNLGYQLSIIELNGSILKMGSDSDGVMSYFSDKNTHHIDLLLTSTQKVSPGG